MNIPVPRDNKSSARSLHVEGHLGTKIIYCARRAVPNRVNSRHFTVFYRQFVVNFSHLTDKIFQPILIPKLSGYLE